MEWRSGKLQWAEIRNARESGCAVRYGAKTARLSFPPGSTVRLNAELIPTRQEPQPAPGQ